MASPSLRAVTTTETRGFTGGTDPRLAETQPIAMAMTIGPLLLPVRWRERAGGASYPDAFAAYAPDVYNGFVGHQIGVATVRRTDNDEVRAFEDLF
jgi:hypothetical protein